MVSNTTGYSNTANGYRALYSNTTGTWNTVLGYNADVNAGNYSNSTAIGNGALVTASKQVRIGNSAVTSIGGYVNWSNISDGRFKKNIKDNVKGLEFIMKLKPVSYNLDISGLNHFQRKNMKAPKEEAYNASEEDAQDIKAKEQIVYSGFVAQEVEKTAKEMGYDFSGVDAPKNDNDVYGLRYADFVVPLVKAVQELSQKNDDLQKQINELKSLITTFTQNNHPLQPAGSVTLSPAILAQNNPNPFTSITAISYELPQQFTKAKIILSDKSGTTLKQMDISGSGKGVLHLDAATLASGVYSYSLIINGQSISTKQMILAK